MSSLRLLAVLPLVLALLAGCDSSPPVSTFSTSTVRLAVSTPAAVPGDISRVTVTVSGPDMAMRSTDLVLTEGAWGGVLGDIPAGTHRIFLARAFTTANTLRYEGHAENITISAGTTGLVSLTLHEVSKPFTNEAPLVDALVASASSVSAGGTVSLSVRAHDPDASDTLSYAWSAPSGTFSATGQADTTWTAPSYQGLVNLSVRVSDSRGAALSVSLSVTVLAVTPGSWTATGRLTAARYRHATAPLPGGKVLVAGGTSSTRLASAEVYDPATGSWSPTGSLVTARYAYTATPLANGQVLVAGGNGETSLASAEVYDPVSGTWSSTGSLAAPHSEHTATLLPNGKVLVAGGFQASSPTVNAELYDPATRTWSLTGSMSLGRHHHTATLLPNGQVLVVGGEYTGTAPSRAELYDPASGTWSSAGNPSIQRDSHTATLLPNGKVLIAGGFGTMVSQKSAELYDPATGTWSPTGSLNSARHFHSATLLPDGKVLVAGGNLVTSSSSEILATAEVYDPATGTWSPTLNMLSPRRIHGAMPLASGQVLVMAGYGNFNNLATAEVYTPATSP
ncbi:kelch repeat-containing protein [Archangium lansingense]|uniref:Kelch repeat-containing protein n=1 Tax=Archangium lansingense TaxID=2995310 RepID=UPI003B801E1F